jgi:hypothetical protein
MFSHPTLALEETTGNSVDRSRNLSADVVTPSLKRTNDLRRNPSQTRERLYHGLVHALEYGVASADLKSSTLGPETHLERIN